MTRRPPYLLVLAFAAMALAALIQGVAPFPHVIREERELALMSPAVFALALATALSIASSFLFVCGAAEVAAIGAGWRRTAARLATVAFAIDTAFGLWQAMHAQPIAIEDAAVRWTFALLSLAGLIGVTAAANGRARPSAWALIATLAAMKLGALPGVDLWYRLGHDLFTTYAAPQVIAAVAGLAAVVIGAPALVPTSARPAVRGLRVVRGALGGRILLGVLAGLAGAIAFAMRHPGPLGDFILYGVPVGVVCVHGALLVGIAGAARAIVPGAPSRRIAAAALFTAIALGFDVRLAEFMIGIARGQDGGASLGELRAIAWIAPGCAAIGLVLFASAVTQIGDAIANRPLARTSVAAAMMLVAGAVLPGAFFEAALKSLEDPRTPTTLSILAGAIGACAAITSAIVRREVAETVRALAEKLAAAPEVPAAIARMPRGDAP